MLTVQKHASEWTLTVKKKGEKIAFAFSTYNAGGEKWISVGQKDNWNCDDTQAHSFFNFDGRRLVRFELPRSLPWDNYRDTGYVWWGHYGGNGNIELPLTLEKIYIERRRHVIYVNSLERTSDEPVILGKLYLEYDSKDDMDSGRNISRPLPPAGTDTVNPIAGLAHRATLPPTSILKVEDPPHYYDGTRGIFFFQTMPEAVSYDIYLSLNENGEQAILLGKNLKKSGVEVNGFRANTVFYAFIVYHDKAGHISQPSRPFKLKMLDTFGNK